jgi:hypothetical protein
MLLVRGREKEEAAEHKELLADVARTLGTVAAATAV